jgi:probable F420-dependent oxidoreductase
MDLGVVFPTAEIGTDPGAIRAYAQAVEDLGITRLVTYDHVLGAVHADREPPLWGPYDETTPFHEPMVLFGFLAATTTRLELATGILILPQRQAALVAKQAVELDLLSEGRFVLGVGTGWNHVEYEALGVPWDDRGARFDEQLEVLRSLWTEPVVDLDGRFHRIDRAGIEPRPPRPIRLWFGGHTERAYRRAVRWGDGFTLRTAGEERRVGLARLRGLLGEAGRASAPFAIDATTDVGLGPDAWRAEAEEWAALGGSLLCLRTQDTGAAWRGTSGAGLHGVDQHVAAVERWVDVVGDVTRPAG